MPGDTLAIQTRTSHNYGEVKNHHDEPPFHLPVVLEDDHFAIVNKPEGIVTYSHKHGKLRISFVNISIELHKKRSTQIADKRVQTFSLREQEDSVDTTYTPAYPGH